MGVYKEQHIQLLYTPVDADGKECGSADLNNFPLIYFATPNDVITDITFRNTFTAQSV